MKKAVVMIMAVAIVSIAAILWFLRGDIQPPDSVFINDAVLTAMQSDSNQ